MTTSKPVEHARGGTVDVALSSFYIQHGPQITPEDDAAGLPLLPIRSDVHRATSSAPIPEDVIPPTHNSRSLLKYVQTKYIDDDETADYSSTPSRSSLPIIKTSRLKKSQGQLGRGRNISEKEIRRLEENDAVQPIGREFTYTHRSDVWSFETSSDASNGDKSRYAGCGGKQLLSEVLTENNITPHKTGSRQSALDSNLCFTSAYQPPSPEKTGPPARNTAILKYKLPSSLTDAARHLSKLSVDKQVSAQFFGPGLTEPDKEHDHAEIFASSSHDSIVQEVTRQGLSPMPPRPPEQIEPNSPICHKTALESTTLPKSQSLWSDLSRWSDEYDKFPEEGESSAAGFAGLKGTVALDVTHSQSMPSVVTRFGPPATHNTSEVAENNTKRWKDPHDTELDQSCSLSGLPTAQNHMEGFPGHEHELDGEPEESSTASMFQPTDTAPRCLLPPNLAARNVQDLLSWALPQFQEHATQLIFEEQARSEALRRSIRENNSLREEITAAQKEVLERDAEISRLLKFVSEDAILFPGSSYPRPTNQGKTEHSAESSLNEAHDYDRYARETSQNAFERHLEDNIPPQPVSRVPLHQHNPPEQRTLPRRRPALPPDHNQRFATK